MKVVVQRLLAIVRRRGVKIRFLLLDKGFFSVEMIQYLRRARYGFIIPAAVRGRKPKDPKASPRGLRALLKKNNGYYRHTLASAQTKEKKKTSTRVTICVASKDYTKEKTGKRLCRKRASVCGLEGAPALPRRYANFIGSDSASRPATGK